jgi:acyl carrier protein
MASESAALGSIKDYVLAEFLAGEDPSMLTPTTPLMTSGILDSLATLKLISFLEKEFDVKIEAHEADEEHFNTLDEISRLVDSKR